MSDLISRQAVLDELEKWDWQDLYLPIHFKQILDDVPSVKNKGEWIESKERSGHWYCSVCGGVHTDPETGKWREIFDYKYPFCPNCGADMRNKSCNTCKNNDDEFSGECYECAKNIQNHYEPQENEIDFPQAKDIEPTVKNFSKVLDNKLIRDATSEEICCFCGGVKRFGICQDCGSSM